MSFVVFRLVEKETRPVASATGLFLKYLNDIYTQSCVPYDRSGSKERHHQNVFTVNVLTIVRVVTAANIEILLQTANDFGVFLRISFAASLLAGRRVAFVF